VDAKEANLEGLKNSNKNEHKAIQTKVTYFSTTNLHYESS
jgi:hypothetical protein